MSTLVRRLIRPNDLAPYGAALATVGLLAMMATYGLRRAADHWPDARPAPLHVEQPQTAPAPAKSASARRAPATATPAPASVEAESFTQSIFRRLRDLAPAARTAPESTAPGATAPGSTEADATELLGRHLTLPVANVRPEQLVRTFEQARGERVHEAIDIMAPRGTAVYAVEDGKIAKLFSSNAGGRTIYQFDPSERFAYYYAHLDAYAEGLADGQFVRRGQLIGQVGSTGNASANAPHLHFAIFRLTSEKRWWEGTAIDPYPILRWALDNEGTP